LTVEVCENHTSFIFYIPFNERKWKYSQKEEKMEKKFEELESSEKVIVIIYGLMWMIGMLIGMGIIPF